MRRRRIRIADVDGAAGRWPATAPAAWARSTWCSWPPASSGTRPPTRRTRPPPPGCSPPTRRGRPPRWWPSPGSCGPRGTAAWSCCRRWPGSGCGRANFVYGASKAGLDAFCQGLAEALRGSGASLMIVRPGWVATRMTAGHDPGPFATTARGGGRGRRAPGWRARRRWCGPRPRCGWSSASCAWRPAPCGGACRAERPRAAVPRRGAGARAQRPEPKRSSAILGRRPGLDPARLGPGRRGARRPPGRRRHGGRRPRRRPRGRRGGRRRPPGRPRRRRSGGRRCRPSPRGRAGAEPAPGAGPTAPASAAGRAARVEDSPTSRTSSSGISLRKRLGMAWLVDPHSIRLQACER